MWYVIQTITGREKELVRIIGKVITGDEFKTCFVIQKECIWRIEGRYHVHIELLFPSYVFVETDKPEEFFFVLKDVPKLTKLLASDGVFLNIHKEEENMLRKMIGEDREYIVRRSLVQISENGEIVGAEGILHDYLDRIVMKRLRKRSVSIEISFMGQRKRIQLGIRLEEDSE